MSDDWLAITLSKWHSSDRAKMIPAAASRRGRNRLKAPCLKLRIPKDFESNHGLAPFFIEGSHASNYQPETLRSLYAWPNIGD